SCVLGSGKERAMIKRVNKVRKSAILEHLLDLERQIRSELARANAERQAADRAPARSGGRSRKSSARDESRIRGSDAAIAPDFAQRYLH
ncbi:MAG: hypothetical protein ACREQ1_04565, partial [Woeseiaceae bacterium]